MQANNSTGYGGVADIRQDTFKHVTKKEEDEEEDTGCVKRLYPSGFKKEFVGVAKLTGPMIGTQLFQYMIGPVSIMFCGHLGEVELAAVALAISFINITGISIALGLACACDTLFAQIYGSTNRKNLGIALQRSLIILSLAVLPCWAIHLNMEALLLLLGQDPFVSRLTADYLIRFMPGILFFFIYVALSKYIQNQNILIPNLIIGAVVNGVNALLHYLLVFVAELGLLGSAISQNVTYFCMMALTLLYILASKVYKDTWDGWSMECLRDWREFIRLAVYGLVMMCVEYWSFEIGIITAGLLGTEYLGAMSVIFQLETFAYMLPLGTGIAASIRVGQYLGSGDAASAQTAARVTMTSILVAEVFVAMIFLTLRNLLPHIFTNVPEVIQLVSDVLPICAVYQLSDGLAGTGAGILRGQGRQNLGAAIVGGGFLLALSVGTPLMLYTSLRLYALWGGLAVALTIEGILFALIIHFNDWEKQAEKALMRVKVTSEPHVDNINTKSTEHTKLIEDDHLAIIESEEEANNASEMPIQQMVRRRLVAAFCSATILFAGVILRLLYTNNITLPDQATGDNEISTAPQNVTWQ